MQKQCLIKINKSKTAAFDSTGKILACVFVKPIVQASAAASPDSGNETALEQMIHLFNTSDYKEKPFQTFTLEGETKEIKSIKFSPNGKFILLGTRQNMLILLDAFQGTVL